jgi:hypothetical protein
MIKSAASSAHMANLIILIGECTNIYYTNCIGVGDRLGLIRAASITSHHIFLLY